MDPPGGAISALDPRFITLFNVIHVTQPSDDSLPHIFNTISSNHVPNFSNDIQQVHKNFTDVIIAQYTDILTKLPTTPPTFHYLSDMLVLSRVFEGLFKDT